VFFRYATLIEGFDVWQDVVKTTFLEAGCSEGDLPGCVCGEMVAIHECVYALANGF